MPQIGGQQREVGFHIYPLAIPGDDPMHRHGVPEVMKARLPPIGRGPMNGGMVAETLKDFFKLLAGDGAAATCCKKRRAPARWLGQGLPSLAIGRQHRTQIQANGDNPCLKELRVPDREETVVEIHITQPQP